MVKVVIYCPLLRIIQTNCTVWVDDSKALYDGRWKTEPVKNLRLHQSIALPLVVIVRCLVCNKPKVQVYA